MENITNAGARVYNSLTLKIYDFWVLQISNQFAWRCSTKKTLLPHFMAHIGKQHLDIGVGTGYYLPYAPAETQLSLLDLNLSSLQAASARTRPKKLNKLFSTMCLNRYRPRGKNNSTQFPCSIYCTAYPVG